MSGVDRISSMLKSTIIAFILSLLPLQGDAKMHLSLFLSELFASTLLVMLINRIWFYIQPTRSVEIGRDSCLNDIVETYIREKKLVGSQNDIAVKTAVLNNACACVRDSLSGIYCDIYEETRFVITIAYKDTIKYIQVMGYTADMNILLNYITYMYKFFSIIKTTTSPINHDITISHITKPKDLEIGWHHKKSKMYKTLENTVFNRDIYTEFFNDVKDFTVSEDRFNKRGIPYKRGYLLYGPPGTGKTSVCKLVAKIHNLPIYCLDLSMIKNNSELISACNSISSGTSNYILLMEDVENSAFFDKTRCSGITMDCLLNILDGVSEPHGRITIMTSNNPSILYDTPALIRPGRIDKAIKFQCVTKEDIEKMYNIFNEETLDLSKYTIKPEMTSAFISGLLYEYMGNKEKFINHIVD